jgi:hypothetical protein
MPTQAQTVTGAPPVDDRPLTITGAPAPVVQAPEVPPAPIGWGAPPPGGAPVRPPGAWNWAAGTVLGLAVLAATVGLPLFATALKFDQLDNAAVEDWLLWGSGALGVICAVSLATRIPALVSGLSAVCAVLGIAAFAMANDEWDAASPATWGVVAYMLGFAILGGCSVFGLRRR